MTEGSVSDVKDGENDKRYTGKLLYASYVVMLILSVIILIAGMLMKSLLEVVIAIPVIFFLIDTLFIERVVVHIPPLTIYLMFVLMIFIMVGKIFDGGALFRAFTDFMFGIVMGLGGLIASHSLMNVIPGAREERPILVSVSSVSVAISMFTIIMMIQYYLSLAADFPLLSIKELMNQLTVVLLGSIFVSVLFYFGKRSSLMKKTVSKYIEAGIGMLDNEEYEIMQIEQAINSRENDKVEFKSTLRTNLLTGEKDPRMEKAVLKTIVAFLNSNGGTLLIGIGDDGTAVGIDEYSFGSRDRMNLHLTNLIASQIGNEYLPYITFRLSDYQGKGVMRVVCRKSDSPVFLKEGKQETFYVRSGPSSVDLNGMDLLNYIDNRFKKRRKKKNV